MKTIYLNVKTVYGIETWDEFTQSEDQTYKEFKAYVRAMIKEYHLGNMFVYPSQKSTKDWKNK